MIYQSCKDFAYNKKKGNGFKRYSQTHNLGN